MRRCPRCGDEIKPLWVVGIDVTSRVGFSVAVLIVFLLADGVRWAFHWARFVPNYSEILWAIGISDTARFLLAYFLLWPSAMHIGHQRKGEWRDTIMFAVLVPLICFMPTAVAEIGDLFREIMSRP